MARRRNHIVETEAKLYQVLNDAGIRAETVASCEDFCQIGAYCIIIFRWQGLKPLVFIPEAVMKKLQLKAEDILPVKWREFLSEKNFITATLQRHDAINLHHPIMKKRGLVLYLEDLYTAIPKRRKPAANRPERMMRYGPVQRQQVCAK